MRNIVGGRCLHRRQSDASGRVDFTYAGTLFASRSPEVFLRGLRSLIDKAPALGNRITVNFFGDFGGSGYEALVRHLNLERIVNVHGFVSHTKIIQKLAAADWLLLIVETIPTEDRKGTFKGVLTGKLLEYLAARKPIFALSPESSAADLIERCRAGVVVPNDSPEAIARELEKIMSGCYEDLMLHRDEAVIGQFSMDLHAKTLARIFEDLAERRRN